MSNQDSYVHRRFKVYSNISMTLSMFFRKLAAQRATPKDIEALEQMQALARRFYKTEKWENFLKSFIDPFVFPAAR